MIGLIGRGWTRSLRTSRTSGSGGRREVGEHWGTLLPLETEKANTKAEGLRSVGAKGARRTLLSISLSTGGRGFTSLLGGVPG